MDDLFKQVNGSDMETFPEGFRYYDEGLKAAKDGFKFNPYASLSWKTGWQDWMEYN